MANLLKGNGFVLQGIPHAGNVYKQDVAQQSAALSPG